jgi:phage terminase large subunit
VGKEIRVLDYYEAQGQPLEAHLDWLRGRKYNTDNTRIYLPHDGVQHDKVYSVSYESALRDAGFDTTIVKNQGAGAAMKRVAAGRRQFPAMWFNEDTTAAGIEALSWYHEKLDPVRDIGLGPEHDWSSHGSDSFGMLAIVMGENMLADQWHGEIDYSRMDRGIR